MPHGARDVAADGADPARGQRRGAEREPRRSGRAGPSVRRQGRYSLPRRPRPRRRRVRQLPREFPADDGAHRPARHGALDPRRAHARDRRAPRRPPPSREGVGVLAVEAKGLSKRFGSSSDFALRELDLAIEEGEVFGLLGPNGAGKTTTLHLLLDFIHPSAGSALLFGRPASDPQTRARVGYLPESLSLHTYYRGASLLRRLGLEDVATRRVSTYSKGTLQRLGFVQALLNDPDLLILDEPTSSLDPLARRQFSEILHELKARRKTILVSSHLLSEVEAICGRVAILKDGAVARSGALVDLLATPSVRMHVGRLSPALVEELIAVGAEVAIAGSNTTVRCPDDAVRAGVVAALEARGVPIERTDTECRSLEELFVETVAA